MQKSWKKQFTVNNCVWLWSGLKSVTNSKRASPKQRTISNWLTTSICSNADLKRTLSHPKHAPTTTKNDLSHSPHGVSPSCLNVWTDQLVPDFTQNCNRSLELFEAPSCFKCSIIIPVPSKKRHYCKWMTTGLLLWHLYTINTISQGAPQGCVLSPLLFPTAAASGHIKLCINHLHHLLKCRCPVITALMVIFACMLPFHYVHTLCILRHIVLVIVACYYIWAVWLILPKTNPLCGYYIRGQKRWLILMRGSAKREQDFFKSDRSVKLKGHRPDRAIRSFCSDREILHFFATVLTKLVIIIVNKNNNNWWMDKSYFFSKCFSRCSNMSNSTGLKTKDVEENKNM